MPHKTYLRLHGARNNIYIDDPSILGNSLEDCERNTKFAIETLEKVGWVKNVDKSTHSEKGFFRSYQWFFLTWFFMVPVKKEENIKSEIIDFFKGEKTSCQNI